MVPRNSCSSQDRAPITLDLQNKDLRKMNRHTRKTLEGEINNSFRDVRPCQSWGGGKTLTDSLSLFLSRAPMFSTLAEATFSCKSGIYLSIYRYLSIYSSRNIYIRPRAGDLMFPMFERSRSWHGDLICDMICILCGERSSSWNEDLTRPTSETYLPGSWNGDLGWPIYEWKNIWIMKRRSDLFNVWNT